MMLFRESIFTCWSYDTPDHVELLSELDDVRWWDALQHSEACASEVPHQASATETEVVLIRKLEVSTS